MRPVPQCLILRHGKTNLHQIWEEDRTFTSLALKMWFSSFRYIVCLKTKLYKAKIMSKFTLFDPPLKKTEGEVVEMSDS